MLYQFTKFIEQWLYSFKTGGQSFGVGFWNPLAWIIAFIIAFLIVYIIRGRGNKDFKENTEQTKVFLSGNPEAEKEKMHVKASNVYWGFLETLKWLYNGLDRMHNGNVSDYVLWFVVILGIALLLIGGI